MPVSLESVRWDELQDAYGPASKVPGLLENVSKAKGRKLHMALGELCSHVLHQGTIYSASPPVARWTIEQAKAAGPEGKEIFYSLLNGFAEAARIAFRDGRAIPCHAGGDPRDGEEIRKAILEAQAQFEGDLNDSSGGVRAQVGELLTAFEDISPTAAKLVQDRYFQESETEVRAALLSGLVRVSSQIADWDAFLSAALVHEDNKENRFTLRQTQVRRGSPGLDAASVDELVATFTGDESFFEAVHALGSDKELEAMLKAFELATETQVLRVLAERLLRMVFNDQRSNWGRTASSLLREDGSRPTTSLDDLRKSTLKGIAKLILWRMFPFLRRWRVRRLGRSKPKGIRNIDYWGLEGEAPQVPQRVNEAQARVLSAFAAKPELWQFRTNLWVLFGLPATSDELRGFVAKRT